MTQLDISRPTITQLLDEFEEDFLPIASVGSRKRFAMVRRNIQSHLEGEGHRFLMNSSHRILNAEFEANPVDAFVRTMHADDLFYNFPHYLAPEHAMQAPLDRRAQLDITSALSSWLQNKGYVDDRTIDECVLIDVNVALREGRTMLRLGSEASKF
jgi:hypothetical protein